MPVTAKLSSKFYERLGDDIASELVDWFNAVDASYKSDLKEMNDLNWERFKDHLDLRLKAMDAHLDAALSRMEKTLLDRLLIYQAGLFVGLGGLMVSLAIYLRS